MQSVVKLKLHEVHLQSNQCKFEDTQHSTVEAKRKDEVLQSLNFELEDTPSSNVNVRDTKYVSNLTMRLNTYKIRVKYKFQRYTKH